MTGTLRRVLWEDGSFKLANLVTLSRGAAIAPITTLLLSGQRAGALALYCLAVPTDVADGWLARRTGRSSEYGAQLDATVDNIFSLAILGFLLLGYPEIATRERGALAILFGVPLLYLGVSHLLTGRLMMFHFWSAKLGGFAVFALWPLVELTGWEGWILIAAAVVTMSRVEQVIYLLRGGADLDAVHGLGPVT